MKRFGRALAVALGIAVLASAVSLVPQKNATADGGAPVNIISPLPLPVTGTVGVNNFPATQNVSITNPSVPVSGTVQANVSFPSSLPMHNLDDPGRIPYQSSADMTGKCPTGPSLGCFFFFASVPSEHRLVAQHVSGIIQAGNLSVSVSLGSGGVAGTASIFFPPLNTSAGVSEFDQQVLVYFDQNQLPQIEVTTGSSSGFAPTPSLQRISLTGYLLDCSAAACEPIAQ